MNSMVKTLKISFLFFFFFGIFFETTGFSSEIKITLKANSTSCVGTDDGHIQSDVSGGYPPYKYSWSNGSSKANVYDLAPGIYTLMVIDSIGAQKITSVEVFESDACKIFPNIVFTPNGDGITDVWGIVGIEGVYKNYLLMVYNRWGQLVHKQEGDAYVSWDGLSHGNPVPDGSYYFVFSPNKDKPTKHVTKGCITIIR